MSKITRHRDHDDLPIDPRGSGIEGHWAAWYAEHVDEDAPLEDWLRHSQPFSPAELRNILDQVEDIRTEDKAWAEAQLRSTQ